MLLGREAGGDTSAEGLANACIRTINRIYRHLDLIIGEPGLAALLARALYLAKQQYPFLGSVEIGSLAESDPLPGLHAAVAVRSASDAREGVVVIIACFVDLFTSIVGQEFGERLIEGAWRTGGTPGSSD